MNSPDAFPSVGVVARHLDARLSVPGFPHQRLEGMLLAVKALVRVPAVRGGCVDPLRVRLVLSPVRLRHGGRLIRGNARDSGVEQVDVVQNLVDEIVLGGDAEHPRFDPQVDVLGNNDDFRAGAIAAKRDGGIQYIVIRRMSRQRLRQLVGTGAGLEIKPSASAGAVFQRNAALHPVAVGAADQLIQNPARLAHVSRRFRHAFLAGVELLQNHQRQKDVVFLKAEDRRRIVHQHVGVEDEELVGFVVGGGH